jgi:hypothetical protein
VREVPSFLVKVMLKNLPLVAAMRSSSWLFIVHYSSPSLAECNIYFDFKAIIFLHILGWQAQEKKLL